ncbi:hypothetical protein Tsubulata_018167 [Turnera subulata]|uniref:Uncharacterized protein n=1 Tax=Turnera subulata TaxID=218843 RepID=A0A9Q0G0I5_9ROSI|nr:hypothetical protein Tsubulata_018167 [Turnera subulata]
MGGRAEAGAAVRAKDGADNSSQQHEDATLQQVITNPHCDSGIPTLEECLTEWGCSGELHVSLRGLGFAFPERALL